MFALKPPYTTQESKSEGWATGHINFIRQYKDRFRQCSLSYSSLTSESEELVIAASLYLGGRSTRDNKYLNNKYTAVSAVFGGGRMLTKLRNVHINIPADLRKLKKKYGPTVGLNRL